jgi:uncharacterized protein
MSPVTRHPSPAAGRGRFSQARLCAIVAALLALQLQAAPARNFLWKVNGRGGAVYVVGSVHLLTKDFYPLNPAVEAAYQDSDLLVEEVDLGDMSGAASQLAFLSHGMLPSTQPLATVLSATTMALLNSRAADLGMPMEALRQFKPWMIALTVEALEWQKAGFDADLGLDKHFYDQAKADGKAVQGLETVEYQISRFDELPMAMQDHLLAETLKDIDTEQANMSRLIEAWRSGDALAVERIVLKDLQQEPQLYQQLLVDRNKNWMPKIDALFARRGHAMVVVGAAHLVGPDGLLTMLKAKGYTVTQQ